MSDPLYRIQAVSKITEVPSATLRAWERRYDFPEPIRTDSGYRLYSKKHIEQIQQLKKLCEQGLAPSEAVKTIKEHIRESTEEQVYLEKSSTNDSSSAQLIRESDIFKGIKQQLIEAIHRFDPVLLEKCTRSALLHGSAKQIFDYIFAPVLKQIGNEWHDGILSIAQEHMATEVIGNAIRDLLRIVQPDDSTKQILLACVSGELHSLPLYGSAFHFIQWGYRVTILGVNTPPEALRQSVARLKPDAVGLSVTCPKSIENTKKQISEYVKACQGRPLIIGGTGTPQISDLLQMEDAIIATGSPQEVKALFEARVARGITN